MSDIQHLHPTVRMHQAVVHGALVYTAGQVAQNARHGDIAEQTADVLQRIDDLLAEAGTNKSRILSANIYLTDMAHFDGMNRVWDSWVAPGSMPARTTVEAGLTEPDYIVEIGVIAAI